MKVCPKCKRLRGDRHTICSQCGTKLIDYNEFMSTKMICPKCDHFYDKTYKSCPTCGVPLISNDEWHKLKDPNYISNSKPTTQPDNQPHCPACGSTNVEKISTASKVGAGIAFGVFSLGHISKTFKCKNCGYKF